MNLDTWMQTYEQSYASNSAENLIDIYGNVVSKNKFANITESIKCAVALVEKQSKINPDYAIYILSDNPVFPKAKIYAQKRMNNVIYANIYRFDGNEIAKFLNYTNKGRTDYVDLLNSLYDYIC